MDQTKLAASALLNGLPGEVILAFTILIWVIFLLILLGNPRNKLNVMCFVSGMTFSVGALKEYLFYTLSPILVANGIWTITFAETLYSVLSAVFFNAACVDIFVYFPSLGSMEEKGIPDALSVGICTGIYSGDSVSLYPDTALSACAGVLPDSSRL